VGIFYSQAVLIQRTIIDFPAFLGHGSAERLGFVPIQTVIRTSRRMASFLSEAAQNFEVYFQKFINKFKKSKTYRG
jgi:hypothetical protein